MIKDGRLYKLHGGIEKMIKLGTYCWECIICGRKQIAEVKPETCSCGQHGNMVLNGNLIVTK